MVRQYAKVVGVVIVLIGVAGLLLGERALFGQLNIDIVEDIVHLATGGLMAFVGFRSRDESTVRSVVGGLGVVYLAVGVIGFFEPELFGLLPHEYHLLDNLIHLTLGVLGIAVAWLLPQRAQPGMAR